MVYQVAQSSTVLVYPYLVYALSIYYLLLHILVRIIPSVNKEKLLVAWIAMDKTFEKVHSILVDPILNLAHQV